MIVDISQIRSHQTRPALFERGAPMWDDPYISQQMLTYHLDESHDISSRRPETIDRIIAWITDKVGLRSGMSLLDMGCGPGLYTRRFASMGVKTTGVDFSQNSIDYAREHDPDTTYICQNYLTLNFENAFDVIVMIYGDMCVLSDQERGDILAIAHRALRSGGYLIFDATTPRIHAYLENHKHWSVAPEGGFWKPNPYLVMERGFTYPDDIFAEEYFVIEDSGVITLYRNWYHDYTDKTLPPIVEHAGYDIIEFCADLTGTPYTDDSGWCAVVAKCRK